MKKTLFLVVTLLAMTGCASGAQAPTTETESPAASAVETTTSPTGQETAESGGTSEYGHRLVALGEEVPLFDADLEVGTFELVSLTPMSVAEVQASYSDADPSLHYFTLEVTANASLDLVRPIEFNWNAIDDQGVLVNGGATARGYNLVLDSSDWFPGEVAAGQTIRGLVFLGVPTEHGSIVLNLTGGSMGQGWTSPFGYELRY